MLELPELEQRLSNLQSQVERLWRKAESSVPPVEQRLAAMADQYAEYLKRWASTVERHTQAVTQLEAYASEWKDASTRVRQETADRLLELEGTIEREWDTLKRMQEEPVRELREQAESLTQVSQAMATASQRGIDRAEARFATFETEVHLRLTELTRELQSAIAEMKVRLDHHPAARLDPSAQWSLDDVTRLHGQLREGGRPGDVPHTIDHAAVTGRELTSGLLGGSQHERSARATEERRAPEGRERALPGVWRAAVAVLGIAVVLAGVFGWRMQGQIKEAAERARVAELTSAAAVSDAGRLAEEARQEAAKQMSTAREMSNRTQRIGDVLAAADLIRFNLFGGNGATGQALLSRSRGLVVSGARLPAPPPNGAYHVWLLTRGAAVKAGTFVPDEDGTATLVQEAPSAPRIVGVMITVEASANVDTPSATAVLSSVVRVEPPAGVQP